jgi:hypothetical protein
MRTETNLSWTKASLKECALAVSRRNVSVNASEFDFISLITLKYFRQMLGNDAVKDRGLSFRAIMTIGSSPANLPSSG